jgi:hypothetical protein
VIREHKLTQHRIGSLVEVRWAHGNANTSGNAVKKRHTISGHGKYLAE